MNKNYYIKAPAKLNLNLTIKNRGIAKENIGDLKGACSDWKKAIELGVTGAAEWVKNQCN